MRWIQAVLQWLPWPVVMGLVGLTALRAGGRGLALFTRATLVYLLMAGYWRQSMNTLSLVVLAVPLSVIAGFLLGTLAFRVKRARQAIEVALDLMQTMPAFAYLIPLLLLFGFGPLVGLIASAIYAIMLYVIVPPIRYVEHGIRHVRPDCVEAARQLGCTPSQLLWQVKLPLAMPVVMLGLNQTIMAALSMLVIAAMVGTRDLGQQVYIALGKANAGLGLTSGLSIALVAMIADRIIRGWCARRKVGTSPD